MARGRWVTDAERERVLQLQRDGLDTKEIAVEVNRSYHFVYRILKDPTGGRRVSVDGNRRKRVKTARTTTSEDGLRVDSSGSLPPAMGSSTLVTDPQATQVALSSGNGEMEATCEPIPFEDATPTLVALDRQWNSALSAAQVNEDEEEAVAPVVPIASASNDLVRRPTMLHHSDLVAEERGHSLQLIQQIEQMYPSVLVAPRFHGSIVGQASSDESEHSDSDTLATPTPPAAPVPDDIAEDNPFELYDVLENEIRRLQAVDVCSLYDAQLLQLMVKFQADIRLLSLQQEYASDGVHGARLADSETSAAISTLVQRMLAADIPPTIHLQFDQGHCE